MLKMAGRRINRHNREESLMERHYRLLGETPSIPQAKRNLDFSSATPTSSNTANNGTGNSSGSRPENFYGQRSSAQRLVCSFLANFY